MRTDVRRPERLEGGRLGELYVRHAPGAVRLAYLLTGDRALSEDLVQDAFVRLAGRFIGFRDPRGLDAYLRTTVVNLARAHFRHTKVERAYLEREAGRPVPEAGGPDVGTERPCGRRSTGSPSASGRRSCSGTTKTSRRLRRQRSWDAAPGP